MKWCQTDKYTIYICKDLLHMMILEYSGWTALFLLKRILIKSLLKKYFYNLLRCQGTLVTRHFWSLYIKILKILANTSTIRNFTLDTISRMITTYFHTHARIRILKRYIVRYTVTPQTKVKTLSTLWYVIIINNYTWYNI